jgi:hypothetical protein
MSMQDSADLWHGFTDWLSQQANLLQTDPDAFGRAFMSSLWNLSIWLNSANKGLTIALVLLVLIVNSILRRHR